MSTKLDLNRLFDLPFAESVDLLMDEIESSGVEQHAMSVVNNLNNLVLRTNDSPQEASIFVEMSKGCLKLLHTLSIIPVLKQMKRTKNKGSETSVSEEFIQTIKSFSQDWQNNVEVQGVFNELLSLLTAASQTMRSLNKETTEVVITSPQLIVLIKAMLLVAVILDNTKD